MAENTDAKTGPVELAQEQLRGVKGSGETTAGLWVKQPESQAEDRKLLAARLCSCDSVCLAVMEDPGDS